MLGTVGVAVVRVPRAGKDSIGKRQLFELVIFLGSCRFALAGVVFFQLVGSQGSDTGDSFAPSFAGDGVVEFPQGPRLLDVMGRVNGGSEQGKFGF